MSAPFKPPAVAAEIIPDTAPFSAEQRQWLNGFFAGMLALDTASVTAVAAPADIVAADDDAPWHDPAMAIADRMRLAEGRALPDKLFAAMAQQNCGQCGYLCKTYSAAIAGGAEARLNLCAPGGKDTFRALKQLMDAAPAAPAVSAPVAVAPLAAKGTARENPAVAVYLGRRLLNGAGSGKETWHHEFDITPDALDYTAGDSFGVFAANDPALVDAVIALIGARPEHDLAGRRLRDVLIGDRALGAAPDALFQLISFVTGGAARAKAQALARGEDPDGDLALLDVLGALHKFALPKLSPEAFVEALDPLQPRLYSISSSPKAAPGRLTLTVDTVRYRLGKRARAGVASTFLADRVTPGDRLRVYVQKAHGFALPSDPATPIIMVGPGTGIAPFRAFLQERAATGAPGRNWLFFGHQRSACDFFYREELEAMQASGRLERLSLAWSRDAAEKTYVQDRMRDNGRDVWAWLGDGAHVYVCGDAKRMAKDVERALVDVVATHGGLSADAAALFVSDLKKAGRYQADVY